ncbi:MAG: Ada metal-binding domain-containing protein [bacterium]|nr:Ada metal-binding domain-containing protein [bacterium]
MVKWFKENQNKIVLAIGMVLVAGIAFGAGMIVNYKEQKEPLVLSENTVKITPITFSVQEARDNLGRAKTDPSVTVKLGEEILQTDGEGNFEFDLEKSAQLTLYNENNVVTIDLASFKNLAKTEGAITPPAVAGESAKQIAPAPVSASNSAGNVGQKNTQTLAEPQKQTGQFVASKNSNKYHLPTCRFAKKIKPENQVWFSSAAEAESRGYAPCGTCMK